MTAIDRRTFLRTAAGVAGAAVVVGPRSLRARAATTTPRPDLASSRRIVVAGAGLAGLTAAVDLARSGWEVIVVEARTRVGGRVHTLHHPFTNGLHAEAGGESIDTTHHQLLALIARFGLTTERRPPQKPYDATVLYRGQREPLPVFLARRGGTVLTDVLRASDAIAALGNGVDPAHPERAARAEQLDARNLDEFVRTQRLVPEADFIVRLQNRSEYNAELRDLSLLFVAQQSAAAGGNLFSTEVRRIAGGNQRLPEAMAATLRTPVRLGAPLRSVEHSADGVRIQAGDGAPIDAAWLVVAMPPPPLRGVHFAPALPAALAAAVDGLDLGAAVKVIREYAAPFWLAEGFSGFTLTDLPFTVAWAATDSRVTAHGILTEFITATEARSAAALADGARIAHYQAQLDRVYPESRPLVTTRAATMAWPNEPFTGGGYAVYRPGQMAPFFSAFRTGTARIRFAGEHTSGLAGYMESAVRSGHRVAREIGAAPR